VDDLHAFLPGAAAWRLRLCARAQREAAGTGPGDRAYESCWRRPGCLPIAPAESWKPAGGEDHHPILLLLGATVGCLLLLAATSPLLPGLVRAREAYGNPYRLFAISNLACSRRSPATRLSSSRICRARAGRFLSWLFTGFAALCAALAWLTPPSASRENSKKAMRPNHRTPLAVARGDRIGAAARVTNHLTQNVASVPLLWLAPLTLLTC